MKLEIQYVNGDYKIFITNSININEKKGILQFIVDAQGIGKMKQKVKLDNEKIVEIKLDGKLLYPKGQQNLIDFLLEKQRLLNYSQEELAKFLDISHPALNYVMNGKRIAGDKIVRNIARKFSLTIKEVNEMIKKEEKE